MHVQPGKGLRIGQVWKKKPDIWLKVNKGLEELTHINDLSSCLLCSSSLVGCPHPLSPDVYLCLASILTKQTVSLYALPLVVVLSLIINSVPAFTAFASKRNVFFTFYWAKIQWKIASASNHCWSAGKDYWFLIQATQVQLLSRE